MNLENLVQPASWMNQEERQTAASLIAAFQQSFAARGLPEDPFLIIRLRELVLHLTLCRRLEQSVFGESKELTPAAAAHIGKALERLRKALKDIEDTANRLDPARRQPATKRSAPPAEPIPENPKTPETPQPSQTQRPANPGPDLTKKVQTPSTTSTPSIGPIRPISPTPPTPTPPTEHPRSATHQGINVPRTVPFAQSQQRKR